MKNVFLIFALCVSALLHSCVSANFGTHEKSLSNKVLAESLNRGLEETTSFVILFDDSPISREFTFSVGRTLDSLLLKSNQQSRNEITVYPFSYNLDTASKFMITKDSIGNFQNKMPNGYGEQNVFQSLLQFQNLNTKQQVRQILVITDGGIIEHHRSYLPEIQKKASEQGVEILFIFLCTEKTLVLTPGQLNEKIKKMKYPVNHIRYNCEDIEQWGY